MTNEQIKALSENSQMARTVLRVLLKDPENMKRIEKLACEDVLFARWCDRNEIWTPSKRREKRSVAGQYWQDMRGGPSESRLGWL